MHIKIDQNKKWWVVSDLHFWHKNVIRYSNRPFNSVEEMNETFIQNWNDRVSSDDFVFNLGDFAFCKEDKIIEILSRLNGTQFYIYGNHDRLMKGDKVQNFAKRTRKIKMFCDVIECNYKRTPLFLSHYSHRVWNRHHYGAIHLYGHSHGGLPGIGRSMDVGVDSKELEDSYAPVLLDDIISFLSSKPIHTIDHH